VPSDEFAILLDHLQAVPAGAAEMDDAHSVFSGVRDSSGRSMAVPSMLNMSAS
jgi:hypothetical protein